MDNSNTTSERLKTLGLFSKISHFKNIFQTIEEFMADGKSFFNLISVNKTFRNLSTMKIDKLEKIINIIKQDQNRYLLFSPYSWLRNPNNFESNKNKFIKRIHILSNETIQIDENDFLHLFNLSKKFTIKLDFDNFALGSSGADIINRYLKNFVNIKTLVLSYCKIDSKAFISYVHIIIKKCVSLQELHLDNNFLDSECGELLGKSIIGKNNLEILNLSGNPLYDGLNSVISILKSNYTVQKLNLYMTKINSSSIIQLSELLNPNKNVCVINYLDISQNDFTKNEEIFFPLFLSLTLNTSIINLYLSNIGLGDKQADLIAELIKKNTTLKVFYIDKNNFDSSSWMKILRALEHNFSLEFLNISETILYPGALTNYFESFPMINLYCLIIKNVKIEVSKKLFEEKVLSTNRKWKIELFNFELDSESEIVWRQHSSFEYID
jgi:Ran GTPase-activating protein (RanGAP) involved in mRNA processing and transport